MDPLTPKYPELTPYQYASNTPIVAVDIDGLEGSWGNWTQGMTPEQATEAAMQLSRIQTKIVKGTVDGIKASVTKSWVFISKDAWKVTTWKDFGEFFEEGIMDMSTVKVTETPKIDAAVKNFETNVIQGDAYSRSKYISEFGTDVLTGYLSSKGLGNLKSFIANTVKTDWSIAKQSLSVGALKGAAEAKGGATLYRIGTTGKSAQGAAAQFWSLENPLADPEAYATKYNVPLENVKNADFIETATLKKGSNFVTREAGAAPGSANTGKGIEVVVDKGGTTNNLITPIKKS